MHEPLSVKESKRVAPGTDLLAAAAAAVAQGTRMSTAEAALRTMRREDSTAVAASASANCVFWNCTSFFPNCDHKDSTLLNISEHRRGKW